MKPSSRPIEKHSLLTKKRLPKGKVKVVFPKKKQRKQLGQMGILALKNGFFSPKITRFRSFLGIKKAQKMKLEPRF